jgi:hypothetical protein
LLLNGKAIDVAVCAHALELAQVQAKTKKIKRGI